MKDKRTYTHLKEHGEDMTHENEFKIDIPEDRGTLDLTRQIEDLKETIKGYDFLLSSLKKEIFEFKKISSENESNKNLLQGYKKVIEDLSNKLRQKDS
jgi:predicted RNase H-like nuclease (RuvC/YqgF family)|tara:strand:+ start:120 stop:413 length:294 start_codon:yes stop_codon:yes gene_type:complete